MRFSFISGIRNDLLQEISNNTNDIEARLQEIITNSLDGIELSLLNIEADIDSLSNRIISPYDYTAATPKHFSVGTTFAIHAQTSRGSYTVPANKKAYVGGVFAATERITTSSSTGLRIINIVVTPSGGSGRTVIQHAVSTNVVNDYRPISNALNEYLDAGDKIEILTEDGSTSGTCNFVGSVAVWEFDA